MTRQSSTKANTAAARMPAPADQGGDAVGQNAQAGAVASAAITVDARTRGRVCLFPIPVQERVADGPVMRGFLETEAGKVQLAGWKRLARESGNEYLSLKLGNTQRPDENAADDAPDVWLVGPFYGRLFKEVTVNGDKQKVRYFGFIEDSEKVGVDPASKQGIYETRWQLQVRAKLASYGDNKHYINGDAYPKEAQANDDDMPF